MDCTAGMVCVDHAASWLVVSSSLLRMWSLLFYCAFTVGGVVVAGVSTLNAAIIVVRGMMVVSYHA